MTHVGFCSEGVHIIQLSILLTYETKNDVKINYLFIVHHLRKNIALTRHVDYTHL